jgi:hypothetical protein
MLDRTVNQSLYLCDQGHTDSGPCSVAEPQKFFFARQLLPVCADSAQENCIESLKFGVAGEEVKSASYVRNVAGKIYQSTPQQAALGLFPTSTVSVWDAPGFQNAGGTTKYSVATFAEMMWVPQLGIYKTFAFTAAIVPVKEKSGSYKASRLAMEKRPDGTEAIGGWGITPGCAYTEDGICGAVQDFAPNSRFELSMRISNQITGWFKGRIHDPVVASEKFSSTNNRVTIAADTVTVPRIAAVVTADNTSDNGKMLLNLGNRMGPLELFTGNSLRNAHSDWHGLEYVEEFRKAAKDTAAATSTLWNVATLAGGAENNDCFRDKTKIYGVVTTNATAFMEGPPAMNNKLLQYKVAGLHFAPDGKTLNEGSYDLVMRSDFARCLYGFSSAPIAASINVTAEGGETKVATTVVSEKNGWLKLAAYGFTFSSPTISVKLSQAAAPATKTTVTCFKGKLTKKVTAVSPQCPAGYKKK